MVTGAGPMILSLRSPELAAKDSLRLASYGLESIAAPVAMPKPVPFDGQICDIADGFIITSQQAAAYLPPDSTDKVVYAVGSSSAIAARAQGYHHVISGGGDGDALAHLMSTLPLDGQLCWLRGQHVSFDIANALGDKADIAQVICYEMVREDSLSPLVIELLSAGKIEAVIALSVGQLRHFEELLRHLNLWQTRTQIELLALSSAIAEAAKESGWQFIYQSRRKRAVSLCALAVCRYRAKYAGIR